MLLLDPTASDERQAEIIGEVRSTIESGGELIGSFDWGSRRLAFEIDDHPDAIYHLYQFSGPNDLLATLDRNLKLTDGLLRFRVIRTKSGTGPPPMPRPDGPSQREERRDATVAARAAADAPRSGQDAEAE